MGMFDQAKDLYKLQKQAKQIKKKLKNIHIEAESGGVTVIVDGEQNFVDVKIAEAAMGDPAKLSKSVLQACNKAISKSQQIAAERMKDVMGDMSGMLGGNQ